MTRRALQIEAALQEALSPRIVRVEDDSARHAGHAGAAPGGETHFNVEVVSDAFVGKSRVERQRMVYGLLEVEFKTGLHALSLKTQTPEEAGL